MKFRLDYTPPESPDKISHSNKIFLAGSCFAENIGNKLIDHRFQCTVNPGGIHFDPLTLSRFLLAALSGESPSGEDLLERSGYFFSYAFHSSVGAPSKEELLRKISSIYTQTKKTLIEADFIFLSFGTALVHHIESGDRPVTNCHKQPGRLFTKKLMSIEALLSSCSELVSKMRKSNAKAKIVLTVSPVKYLRDGPVNNNLSKSTLLLLAQKLCNEQDCFYFPAFEIMNDDLRDYRFYKEDLAHPNDLAIAYIWEKFMFSFFSPLTRDVTGEIEKLNRALAHRPLHAMTEEQESLESSIKQQKQKILALDPNVRL